jgi:universal stress protein A
MSPAMKRILVPVDFNVPSRAALNAAADLAQALGASLQVLHVIDLPTDPAVVSEGHVPLPVSYRQAVRAQAKKQLDEWLTTTAAPGTPAHVIDGAPAEEIVRFVGDHAIDLIVMGTHGKTGISHLFTGSVTERVVRAATCPVMTVRPRG